MSINDSAGTREARRSPRSPHRIATAALAVVLAGVYAVVAVSTDASDHKPRDLRIWLTGYSWQDNTPPSSAVVSHPLLHHDAGGTGTYADPITVAVAGDKDHMTDRPGTRFYLPTVRRYVIVEDSGASPIPPGDDTHLDMWVDGRDGTKNDTDACEQQITGKRVPAEINPPDDRPVTVGPIYANHSCNVPQLPAINR